MAASGATEGDMTVTELKARMDRGDAPLIVDVREPAEFEICRIPGAVLIPLSQLPSRARRARCVEGDRPAVQGRRAQRERDRVPQARGIRPRPEPDRRHPRLDRSG